MNLDAVTLKDLLQFLQSLSPLFGAAFFLMPPFWKRVGPMIRRGIGIDELQAGLKANTESQNLMRFDLDANTRANQDNTKAITELDRAVQQIQKSQLDLQKAQTEHERVRHGGEGAT